MPREEKRYGFRPVDDTPEPRETEETVIRLGGKDTPHVEKTARAAPASAPAPREIPASHRLHVPGREEFESRTHQPGIEALIEHNVANPDHLEQTWGGDPSRHLGIPWGWFVLIALLLAGAAAWSLRDVQKAEAKVEQIQEETETNLTREADEDREAIELIARIDAVADGFSAATDIDTLARFVRQPERVRPLMEQYYSENPLVPGTILKDRMLQPLEMESQAGFWMKSFRFANGRIRPLAIEVLPSGEPKVDWEMLVCYQPMKWDDFALQRPAGKTVDFRVLVKPDNFFSHEFADSTKWDSFRLTAPDSEETLFGYVPKGGELAGKLEAVIKENPEKDTPLILRLTVPEGVQSRRGVIIGGMPAPRWIYLDPPESGS